MHYDHWCANHLIIMTVAVTLAQFLHPRLCLIITTTVHVRSVGCLVMQMYSVHVLECSVVWAYDVCKSEL